MSSFVQLLPQKFRRRVAKKNPNKIRRNRRRGTNSYPFAHLQKKKVKRQLNLVRIKKDWFSPIQSCLLMD